MWPAGKTVSILLRSTRGGWRLHSPRLPVNFSLPFCQSCHLHSSASSWGLVCAPTSLTCQVRHLQSQLSSSLGSSRTNGCSFSAAKGSCLVSTRPTPSIRDSRRWPRCRIKNSLRVYHLGKPLLLHGRKIYIPALSISLRNFSCQSLRDINFPIPSTTTFITKNGGLYALPASVGHLQNKSLWSPTTLESCIKLKVKTLNWIVGKYAMSRFKFCRALNLPFLKQCCNIIFFQAWCSDLPFKQITEFLSIESLGGLEWNNTEWLVCMHEAGLFKTIWLQW